MFGVTKAWADKYPNTHLALIKALMRAAQWLDASMANRKEAGRRSRTRSTWAPTRRHRQQHDRHLRVHAGRQARGARLQRVLPVLRQLSVLQRRDLVPHADAPLGPDREGKPDSWYLETAKKVYRPDIYLQAAKLLIDEGKISRQDVPWDSDGFKAPTKEFIDGVKYDGRKPNAYIDSLTIGLKGQQTIEGGNVVGK